MELKQKVAKGFLWVGLGTVAGGGLQFITKIILVKLLTPADFGLMALALFVITYLALFQEAGLENALIQRKGDIDKAADAVFMITPVIGLVLSALLFFSSGLIAGFYRDPKLGMMLKVISPMFLIASFRTVQSGLLQKNLYFQKKFKAEIISIVGYAVVSITLARNGFGVWSLVWGYLSSVSLMTISLWIISSWRPSFKFDYKIAKSLFNFGKHILGIGIVAFIFSQGDVAFIGRYLGKVEVGFYAVSYTFANISAVQITHTVAKVLYPTFSGVQDDKEKLKKFFLKTTRYTMLIVVPCITGTFILGRHIPMFLGPKWNTPEMALTLRILSIFAFFRSLHIISSILLQSIGKPRIVTKLVTIQLVAMVLIIYPFTRAFNIAGTAAAMALIMLFAGTWLLGKACRILKIDFKQLLSCFNIPVIASLGMALFVYWVSLFLKGISAGMQILALVLIGMVVYSLAVYLLDRNIFKKGINVFRAMAA